MKKNYLKFKAFSAALTMLTLGAGSVQAQTVTTFSYSGAAVSFTVPPCVTTMSFDVRGAEGGDGYQFYSNGGRGGRVTGVMSVTSGQVLQIRVGGFGANATQGTGGAGGFNGGGLGASYPSLYGGGGGGGASDIRLSPYALADRIVVAGGGGGGAFNYSSTDYDRGGHGGGTTGEAGLGGNSYVTAGGGGGTQSAGGIAGYYSGYCTASTGAFGVGGAGGTCGNSGGGGGGGYYGGGGGVWGGGGGGSNYASGTFSTVSHTQGFQTGNGLVTLSYFMNGSAVTVASSPTAICTGNSATLTGSGVTSYTWSNSSNASSIVVAPGSNTTYTVSGTNSNGCVTSAMVTVTVSTAPPVLTVNSSTNNTCLGKAVTLTASGALTHTWTGGVTNGVPFTPSATNSYTVTGTNGCGSTNSVATITVAPLPIGVSATNTFICQLNTATLTAAGATTYTWAPGNQTVSTIIVNPSASTIYTVTASDGTCQGVATITVNTKPNPTITVVASNSNICGGQTASLTATGADTYTWNTTAITGSAGVVTPTTSTLYQVSGTNSVGCTTGANQVIVVKQTPNISASANPTLVCVGGAATLNATGNSDSYSWSHGAGTAKSVISPTVSGSYTVTGTLNSTGCSSMQVVSVNVFQPVLPVSPSTTVCLGTPVTLTAGAGSGYVWSNGTTNFDFIVVTPTAATVYSVSAMTVSNNVTCLSKNTIQVGVNPKPTVTASAQRTVMCRFESVSLTGGGATSYTWSNKSNSASTTFSTNLVMTHSVTLIGVDDNGCRDTAAVLIKVNTCTGIAEIGGTVKMQVYPNPNSGEFIISAETGAQLALSNELGQVVRTFTLNEQNSYKADVKDLAAGIYMLSGTSGDRPVSQKIVVSK